MEQYLKQNEHTIKVVTLVVIAIFTLCEYFDFRNEQKVERTIKLNEDLYKENVVNSRHVLELALFKERENIPKFFDELDKKYEISDPKYKKATLDYMAELVSKHKIENNVLSFFDFYTAIQDCVDTGICDLETAKTMYASNPRDTNLLDTYCTYILYYREFWGLPDYAKKALFFGKAEKCKW